MTTQQITISPEQAYFEIYKALPYHVKSRLRDMIDNDAEREQTLLARIEKIQESTPLPFDDLIKELDKEGEKAMKAKGMTLSDVEKTAKEMNRNRTAFKQKMRGNTK